MVERIKRMFNGTERRRDDVKNKACMAFVQVVCFILIVGLIMVWYNRMTMDAYEKLISGLGLPTLIGMAFNAIFNDNKQKENHDEKNSSDDRGSVITPAHDG